MTGTVQVGGREIAYTVRFSDRARKKRIVVTPERVEVVAPVREAEGANGVQDFVRSKRKWILNAVDHCRKPITATHKQRYVSGAKLLYRGRRLMIRVRSANVETVEIDCRSRFWVKVPKGIPEAGREATIARAFDEWLNARAASEVVRLANRYAGQLGIEAKSARICDQKRMWGTCGKDGVVRVNWRLMQAPLAAMEYVVAHEVCHLIDRSHSRAFWRLLGGLMPDWRERKSLLELWGRDCFDGVGRVGGPIVQSSGFL